MKLLVQARKDGYNVLYPKPTPAEFFQFAGDIRRIDNNSGNFLGKYIYSIALSSGGCIFTKHVIVQDVQREGLGNVGFSIFIPNVKKLSGVNVKTLLDELQETYREKYCPDYYLANKQEDWMLFEAIANKYENSLTNLSTYEVKNYQQGSGEAAFAYYSDDAELEKYFDAPFQEEYSACKQVFLVEKRLKDTPENPLNAIRYSSNANLTDKIDLSPSIILKVYAHDDDNNTLITNYKVRRLNEKGNIQEDHTELIFKNDEIHRPWHIVVKHNDYDEFTFDYYPTKGDNIKHVKLKKKQYLGNRNQFGNTQEGIVYRIKIDKNKWKRSSKGNYIPDFVYESPSFKLDAKFGYKFIDWELEYNPINNGNHYYKAIFKEKWHHKISKWVWVLIFSIFIAIASIFVISKLSGNSESDQPKNLSKFEHVKSYVDGIELNINDLQNFESLYCNSSLPPESNEYDKSLLQRFWPFESIDNEILSQESQLSHYYCLRIKKATNLRMKINLGEIDILKGISYSEQQQKFKSSIDNIDDKFIKQIGDTLNARNLSSMNLDEVAELITRVQRELKKEEQPRQDEIGQRKIVKKNKEELNNHLYQSPTQQIKENFLESEFWELVKKPGKPEMDDYTLLVNKYYQNGRIIISNPSVLDQDIISFLLEICANSKAFKNYRNELIYIDMMDKENAKTLTELMNLLKNQK